MNVARHIAIINHGEILKSHARELNLIAAACVGWYNGRVAPAWNTAPISSAYYADPHDVPKGSTICAIVDTDASVPNAEAWHDLVGDQPTITVLADVILNEAKGGILTANADGVSLPGAIAHEYGELGIDVFCNAWVQMPDGRFVASEICDPVQDGVVPLALHGTVVSMSDAVTPAYFDPQAPAGTKCSLLGFDQPFGRTPGGYQIIFDPAKLHAKDGPISEEFGEAMPEAIRRMKSSHARRGRTARRIANFYAREAALTSAPTS